MIKISVKAAITWEIKENVNENKLLNLKVIDENFKNKYMYFWGVLFSNVYQNYFLNYKIILA